MYTSLNDFLKKEYGCKIYKLALSAVPTCPNRDGTLGHNGCIFCGEDGSGSFATPCSMSATEQIEQAKLKIKNKTIDNTIQRMKNLLLFNNIHLKLEKLILVVWLKLMLKELKN